jgi:hypothetical protein
MFRTIFGNKSDEYSSDNLLFVTKRQRDVSEEGESLFGSFAKLLKAIITCFLMSVCASDSMEQFGSRWTDLCEMLYWLVS